MLDEEEICLKEELRLLRRKVLQLEEEAENMHRLNEATIAHDEATLTAFASRCFGTAVAWATSQMVFKSILAAMSEVEGAVTELVGRCLYAFLAVLLCPLLQHLSRPGGPFTQGTSFVADFMRLVSTCTPMILMWALMDVFTTLVNTWDQPGWDELLIVVILSLLLGAAEMLPCYVRSKKAVDTGVALITERYCVLPSFFVLSLGRMCNEFGRWPVSLLQGKPPFTSEDGERQRLLRFVVELVYSTIVCYAVTWITAWWSLRSGSGKPQKPRRVKSMYMEHHHSLVSELEHSAGQLLISALAFVYAWALSFLLQDFFFQLLFRCDDSCTSPVHFCYGVTVTVTKIALTTSLEYQDVERPWGKASQMLTILANSLCVGWAWKGYFGALIQELHFELGGSEVLCYFLLCLGLWLLAGSQWHRFLSGSRHRGRKRMKDFASTRCEELIAARETQVMPPCKVCLWDVEAQLSELGKC